MRLGRAGRKMAKKIGKVNECTSLFPMTGLSLDTCSEEELSSSLKLGVTGASCKIPDFSESVRKDAETWQERIGELLDRMKETTEEEIASCLMEETAASCAKTLLPVYDRTRGAAGRFAVPVNIRFFRSTSLMLEAALRINSIGRNMTASIPASSAGMKAMEEATYRGVNVCADFCFSTMQAVQAAEAIEKGLKRREAEGLEVRTLRPACSFRPGTFDRWIYEAVKERGIFIDPECLIWAGTLTAKEIYRVFREKGFRAHLMLQADGNHYAWSEMIGGELTVLLSGKNLQAIDTCGLEIRKRIEDTPDRHILEELLNVPEFKSAYRENGMKAKETKDSGAYRDTMMETMKSQDELLHFVRRCAV